MAEGNFACFDKAEYPDSWQLRCEKLAPHKRFAIRNADPHVRKRPARSTGGLPGGQPGPVAETADKKLWERALGAGEQQRQGSDQPPPIRSCAAEPGTSGHEPICGVFRSLSSADPGRACGIESPHPRPGPDHRPTNGGLRW